MTEDFERGFAREERAFRATLATRAEAYQTVDRTAPRPPRRRPPWRVVGEVAAVLALIGGIITIVATTHSNHGGNATSSSGVAAGVATTPAAGPGMRWVSRFEVAVQVPSSWPYAVPPGGCIYRPSDYNGPKGPYVGVPERGGKTSRSCASPPPSPAPKAFGSLPFRLWQPHLTFARAGARGTGPDGTWTYRGWTLTRWTAGDVQLSLLTRPGEENLARRIRISVRVCAVTSLDPTVGARCTR